MHVAGGVAQTIDPTHGLVRLPVPGCVRGFRYDYPRELRLWLLSLPGRVLLVVVFLMLDLRAYFAWARVGRDLARDTLAWSWANLCDWLRPPPCTHVRIECELRAACAT